MANYAASTFTVTSGATCQLRQLCAILEANVTKQTLTMLHHNIRRYSITQPFIKATVLIAVAVLICIATVFAPLASANTSAPVVYNGSQWFGGTGVNVCTNTNGGGTKNFCGNESYVGGVAGARWQCVEFAQRFYKKMGWHSGVFSGVWLAHDIYDTATQNGFTRQANGSITNIEPGDMIVHHKDAPYTYGAGHVAVVDRIQGSIIHAVEQNTGSPTAAYTLSGKVLSRQNVGMIRGIVKPRENVSNHSSGEATSLTYATAKDESPMVFSGSRQGSVYQTDWKWTNGSRATTKEITKLPSPITAIASVSSNGSHPEVYVGTESGALYLINWTDERRYTTRIASLGSSVLSIDSASSPAGIVFVYSGTANGQISATQYTESSDTLTSVITDLHSPINSLSMRASADNPGIYAGTQNGKLFETTWSWEEYSYASRQLASVTSAINSIELSSIAGGIYQIHSGTQDGSIYQTVLTGTTPSVTKITQHSLPVTALTSGVSSSRHPRLYSATSDGRIYQTHWGDTPLGTSYFGSVNGRINQIVYAKTDTGHPRLFSASSNGGIYQTHWGDSKLGVLQLARP